MVKKKLNGEKRTCQRMRIGIFGGSFDPVHAEHVNVAKGAVKSLKLNKLFVMPAFAPPHKKDKILSSDQDRLAMCRLAFSSVKNAPISASSAGRSAPVTDRAAAICIAVGKVSLED